MVFKQDNIQVKYAILNNDIPPPLIQDNEENEDSKNNKNNKINDIQSNNLTRTKVTFVNNIMSNDSVRGSISDYIAPFSPTNTEGFNYNETNTPRGGRNHANCSRIDIMDATKLAKINFINDTNLETIILNRYDRDFVRPMIIKKSKTCIIKCYN